MAKFQNSITHCLSECDHCTGAYCDDRNIILLTCRCYCHNNNNNNDSNKERGLNKQIGDNHEILSENSDLSSPAKGSI